MRRCALCRTPTPTDVLAEARWLDPRVVDRLIAEHPRWRQADGACPACIQEALLDTLHRSGRNELAGRVQNVWPLDAGAAFGALPTPLRMRADSRFTGRGLTLALVDADFAPHPDLVRPTNRIRAWADASREALVSCEYGPDDIPTGLPSSSTGDAGRWHGLMTSATAAGNGWLSHGLYRGLAPDADLVLVQVADDGRITNDALVRALQWIADRSAAYGIRVVSMSVAGEAGDASSDAVEEAVATLVSRGVTVVCAAGNAGRRALVPPATAIDAITVGGLDDHNVIDARRGDLWHSDYGVTRHLSPKPEVVAPSIWVVAPLLPGTAVAREASALFDERARRADAQQRIDALKLVTPHYQHVEGTSFAAPIVAGVVACMLESHPGLTPARVKELLMLSATRVEGAPDDRQGAGAVDAGLAVAAAQADRYVPDAAHRVMPIVDPDHVRFVLHDHHAQAVTIVGSWNGWRVPGAVADRADGAWRASVPRPSPGRHSYKYLLDGSHWLPDPANPYRVVDDNGQVNSVFVTD